MPQNERTVPRGVLWLVVSLAGFLILALATISASTISNWALMVDQRGLANQAKISAIENRQERIEGKVDYAIKLLEQHVVKDQK